MKAPFPYFGGKAPIANLVWEAFGQPDHYIEPFFGSGAVLLARPQYDPLLHTETICDSDGYIANVWRALQFNPDEVARWCDWPVNHADLSARKTRLIENKQRLLDGLIADPEWFDAKLAGYWIWAASCWIGSGMTSIGQRPNLSCKGTGVHAIGQRPHLIDKGTGVHAIGQRPQVIDKGRGVHAIGKRPQVIEENHNVQDPYNTNIYKYFRELSERLRYVRVVCGDWSRVCGGNWQNNLGTVGMYFDPPYAVTDRRNVYDVDSNTVAHAVRNWVIERGANKAYRIVLSGYEEHQTELSAAGWAMRKWKTSGGYANITRSQNKSRGKINRIREVVYFSPYCLNKDLFKDLFSDS